MRSVLIIFLSLVCLVNIGWVTKDSKVQEDMQKAYQSFRSGNLTEAMNIYEDILRDQPKNVEALNDLGVIYEEVGQPDRAEEKYLSALTLNKQYLPTYANLGFLYWNQGELDKAAFYLNKRVQEGNPNDSWTIKCKVALKKVIVQEELQKQESTSPNHV